MPSGGTATELITDSLRLIGMVATGETPGGAMSNDGLRSLNDLLELMSLSNLTMWGSDVTAYTCTAGIGSYTIGATAIAPNFIGPRPVSITGGYIRYQSVDFPLSVIGQEDYNNLGLKAQGSDIPLFMTYINDFPLGIIKLWPVPSTAVVLYLNDDRVLTQLSSLATVLAYPQGYYLYMRNALAIMQSAEYGVEPAQTVVDRARETLGWIKRRNGTKAVAQFDPAITSPSVYTWQQGV